MEQQPDSEQKTPQQPQPKRLQVDLNEDLVAVYSNGAMITNTPAELIFDFVQALPRMPKGKVLSRIIMSPLHAKLLYQALGQNLAGYERQYGQIRIPNPNSLADQFFRFPRKEGNEE